MLQAIEFTQGKKITERNEIKSRHIMLAGILNNVANVTITNKKLSFEWHWHHVCFFTRNIHLRAIWKRTTLSCNYLKNRIQQRNSMKMVYEKTPIWGCSKNAYHSTNSELNEKQIPYN